MAIVKFSKISVCEFLLDFKRKSAEMDGYIDFNHAKVKWSVPYLHRMKNVLEFLSELKLSAGSKCLIVYGVPSELPAEIKNLWVEALNNYGFNYVLEGELTLNQLQHTIHSINE